MQPSKFTPPSPANQPLPPNLQPPTSPPVSPLPSQRPAPPVNRPTFRPMVPSPAAPRPSSQSPLTKPSPQATPKSSLNAENITKAMQRGVNPDLFNPNVGPEVDLTSLRIDKGKMGMMTKTFIILCVFIVALAIVSALILYLYVRNP